MSDHENERLASYAKVVGTVANLFPEEEGEEEELSKCSITAHCFVSNRHTGEPGCVTA
jgi:hypothetical protein